MTRFIIPFALTIGCGSEDKLSVYDAAPTAFITSHASGEEVHKGEYITFVGTVSDDTDDADSLSVTWLAGETPACPAEAPMDDGLTTCEIEIPEDEQVKIRLEVRDPGGNIGEHSVTLDIRETEAPTVSLFAPVAGDAFVAGDAIAFSASVDDREDSPEDLTVWFESSLDGRIELTSPPTTDGELAGSIVLTAGSHDLHLWAQDSDGQTGSSSAVITVNEPNVAPTCEITAPEAGATVAVGSLIVMEATVGDADGPSDWLTAEWSSDEDGPLGESAPSSSGETAFPIDTLSPNTHTIALTVTDDSGATCSDFTLLTVSTPPEITVTSPADGATANQGSTVVFAAEAVDAEDFPGDLLVDWTSSIDGTLSSGPPDSAGDSVFTSDELSAGTHTLTITVTDTDGLYATTVQLLNVNGVPSAPSVGISPTEPKTNDDLNAILLAPSTDPDGDPVTYAYAWRRDGVDAGPLDSTLPATETAKGQTWSVVVTPSDDAGSGETATASVTIANTPPSLDSAVISPEEPQAGDALTCGMTGATDADGDGVTASHSWTVNGLDAGVDGATLAGAFAAGDTVQCTAVPFDGEEYGDAVTSDAVEIGNSVPSIATALISPETATVGVPLTCSWTGFSDADGDADLSTLQWRVNGVDAGSTPSLTSGFVGGDSVDCTVTPFDGTDTGTPASASITIGNSPPSAPVVSIEDTDGEIICVIDVPSVDFDGESISYNFAWDVDGEEYADAVTTLYESDTVSDDELLTDEVWTCSVTAFDGTDSGPAATASITVVSLDSDGDGVLDEEDLCEGHDDSIDGNGNGIPDACEAEVVFGYTGAPQTFTVPVGTTQVFIEAEGAKGFSAGNPGGEGGYASGTLTVTEGEELYVYVGGHGNVSSPGYVPIGGGWNGGGDGQNNGSGSQVGGGGGASDVRLVFSSDPLDSDSLASRVLVAGGGGGGTSNGGAHGGHGGGLEGQDGGQHSGYHYGRGGTQTAGGGANGGFGYGGYAEGYMTPWNGGGGGGWYGGGVSEAHSGGGGGSSYTGGVIDGTVARGGSTGHGQIVIYWAEETP